jgi:hypothetical protein
MIDPKEFIRGEYFPNVCDMRVGTEEKLPYTEQLEVPDKNRVSIYAKTEYLSAAMDVIRANPDNLFTLVTHNSDLLAAARNPPANLHRWFAQNRGIDRDGVYSLPIGLENEHWFPYKQQIMLKKKPEEPRIAKAFAQFNPNTHPERNHALSTLSPDTHDVYAGANGDRSQHSLFCNNLAKYAFCLCPRGNGTDTHRLWEALYMGCIPICKTYVAHKFDNSLPVLFVKQWEDITKDLLEQAYKYVDRSLFNSDLLKMSYWSKRINNEL